LTSNADEIQADAPVRLVNFQVGSKVEHFVQAVQERSSYSSLFVKFDFFREVYLNVDADAYGAIGLGFLLRANFYMSIIRESALDVHLEGKYESASKVVYQNDKLQLWRKVTTDVTIDGQSFQQVEEAYVGALEAMPTSQQLKQYSIDYLNTYLVPNGPESEPDSRTPFINDVKFSEMFQVQMKNEKVDKNGICVSFTVGSDTYAESKDKINVWIRFRHDKSDKIYAFHGNNAFGPFPNKGQTYTKCDFANEYVSSLEIEDVVVQAAGTDGVEVAAGSFHVRINGAETYFWLYNYGHAVDSQWWLDGDKATSNSNVCEVSLKCLLDKVDK